MAGDSSLSYANPVVFAKNHRDDELEILTALSLAGNAVGSRRTIDLVAFAVHYAHGFFGVADESPFVAVVVGNDGSVFRPGASGA